MFKLGDKVRPLIGHPAMISKTGYKSMSKTFKQAGYEWTWKLLYGEEPTITPEFEGDDAPANIIKDLGTCWIVDIRPELTKEIFEIHDSYERSYGDGDIIENDKYTIRNKKHGQISWFKESQLELVNE